MDRAFLVARRWRDDVAGDSTVDPLRDALVAEEQWRLGDAFVLCRKALERADLQADGFNLLGRLYRAIGDDANAIASQRHVLRIAPGHERAAADLEVAIGAIRSPADGATEYARAVGSFPDIATHHRDPISLLPFAGMDDVEASLLRAIAFDPSLAAAHAALGNVRARRGRLVEAFESYRISAMLAWDRPAVHLALATFFDALRDDESASRHRDEAFSRERIYPAIVAGTTIRVLALTASGDPTVNAPIDYAVDHARVALHRYYLVPGERPTSIPPYDLVFNLMEYAESSADAIERCDAVVAAQERPVLNDPRHLAKVRRSALAQTLRKVAGCIVPDANRLDRDRLATALGSATTTGIAYPWIVRPVDTHRGDHQELIHSDAELVSYLESAPGSAFDVSAYVDYRSADGYFRKYRVIVVDAKPYAYHLAIADTWKVHYHSSQMFGHPWMRLEEERFLCDPRSVFVRWDGLFAEIADNVGLDYFGVDCTIDAAGDVVVFECGPSMLVQCRDARDLFAYKYRHVPKIFAALEDLLYRTASSPKGSVARVVAPGDLLAE